VFAAEVGVPCQALIPRFIANSPPTAWPHSSMRRHAVSLHAVRHGVMGSHSFSPESGRLFHLFSTEVPQCLLAVILPLAYNIDTPEATKTMANLKV
jgi:hypothetical protein